MKKPVVFWSVMMVGMMLVNLAPTVLAGNDNASTRFLSIEQQNKYIRELQQNPYFQKYPALLDHLYLLIRHEQKKLDVDPRLAKLLGGNGQWAVEYTVDDLKNYFNGCYMDGTTMLRTMPGIAYLSRRMNTLFYLSGKDLRQALKDLNLSPGLSLPIEYLYLFAYIPDVQRAARQDDFQSRGLAIIQRQYTHRFRKEVLNANLKIGTGQQETIANVWGNSNVEWTGYLINLSMVQGNDMTGFTDVDGIGGEKRGFMGFMQKLLFFLPDAVDSMTINANGDMITKALITETIVNFEKGKKYQVHKIGDLPWEDEVTTLNKNNDS